MSQGLSEKEVRDLLRIAFEYSFQHDDWVEPWADALEGISAEQALWRPGPDLKGIWDIVLHVANWNENIIARIETGETSRPAEGAWPLVATTKTEGDWEDAKARLWKSIEDLRVVIDTCPLDKIRSSPYGFGDLACRFLHMAYHAGQVVKIMECNGW